MNHIEWAISRARNEWQQLGTLTTSTVMELTNLGLDVEALEGVFASE